MVSTLPREASSLIVAILTSASWNSGREVSLQRAPSGVWGMCARIWGASLRRGACRRGLFSKGFAEDVLRGWGVERALWFGFHLPGTQLRVRVRSRGRGCLDNNNTNKMEYQVIIYIFWVFCICVCAWREWETITKFYLLHNIVFLS